MKKQLIILAALLPLLGGCVYDFEAELTGDQYTVVVEGDIIVGGMTTVSFTRLNPELLEGKGQGNNSGRDIYYASSAVIGALPPWGIPVNFTARVEGEDGTVVEGQGIGGMCSLDTRSLNPGVKYRLCLHDDVNDLNYASSWESVQTPPVIDSLSYKINGNMMDVCVTFHSDGSTPYYCLSYDEQWEYHAYANTYMRYVPRGGEAPEKGIQIFPDERFGDRFGRIFDVMDEYPNYTCWNSTMAGISTVVTTGAMVSNKMVDYVFRSLNENDRRISVAYRPIVTVRMISQKSYEYWKSLEETSTQTGDLFSPIPSTRRGNILGEENPKAPVIGYVGVSAAATGDLFIKNKDTQFYRTSQYIYNLLKTSAIGSGDAHGVGVQQMASEYMNGNRPWKLEFPDSDNPDVEPYYVWIPERCLDCRTQGGFTYKPEGWPE